MTLRYATFTLILLLLPFAVVVVALRWIDLRYIPHAVTVYPYGCCWFVTHVWLIYVTIARCCAVVYGYVTLFYVEHAHGLHVYLIWTATFVVYPFCVRLDCRCIYITVAVVLRLRVCVARLLLFTDSRCCWLIYVYVYRAFVTTFRCRCCWTRLVRYRLVTPTFVVVCSCCLQLRLHTAVVYVPVVYRLAIRLRLLAFYVALPRPLLPRLFVSVRWLLTFLDYRSRLPVVTLRVHTRCPFTAVRYCGYGCVTGYVLQLRGCLRLYTTRTVTGYIRYGYGYATFTHIAGFWFARLFTFATVWLGCYVARLRLLPHVAFVSYTTVTGWLVVTHFTFPGYRIYTHTLHTRLLLVTVGYRLRFGLRLRLHFTAFAGFLHAVTHTLPLVGLLRVTVYWF